MRSSTTCPLDAASLALGVEGVDEAGAKKLFAAVDTNASGRVNYLEFLDAFQVTDRHANSDSWKHARSLICFPALRQLHSHTNKMGLYAARKKDES